MANGFSHEISNIRSKSFTKFRQIEENFCLKMEELWVKMFGKNKETAVERYSMIYNHLEELFSEMFDEEQERYESFRSSIEELLNRSRMLQKELSVSLSFPFEVDIDGINLQGQVDNLTNYLDKYEKIRAERISVLNRYKEEEASLASKLGFKMTYNLYNKVPSDADLKEIKMHLHNLKIEKETRHKKYLNILNEIKNLMSKIEIIPTSDFERCALDDTNFLLTTENMEKLQDWKIHLSKMEKAEIKLIADLKDKISLLWDRLDVEPNYREDFLIRTTKITGKTLKDTLLKELNRCEELKKLNLENVIIRLREEILDLWDRCHISAEERNEFFDFYSLDYNEELLVSHEKKVENLTKFYAKTSDLYGLAEKWFELWNKMLSLENQSSNIGRLNNRGGQLLKEERERKRIQKELPKVETKLQVLVTEYENVNSVPFLYNGQPLMQLISLYWENRKTEKENEKEVRKIQNATKLTPLKSSSATRIMTGPSPGFSNSRKRGRPLTPVENLRMPSAKRELKMVSSNSKKIVQVKRRSRSQDPPRSIFLKRRSKSQDSLLQYRSNMNLRSTSANSSLASYAGFQSNLRCVGSSTPKSSEQYC